MHTVVGDRASSSTVATSALCRRRGGAARAARAGSGRARRAGSAPAPSGVRPSTGARSSRSTSTRARSTWRRNSWPSPRPSAAPSMSPGMSASTNSWSLEAHDAEVGLERGERVVGDLGLRRADRGDQRRLARVGEADQRGVGEQLDLEPQPALLAVLALLGEAGRAARVRQEPGVAAPAAPAVRRRGSGRRGARGRRAARRRASSTSVPSGTRHDEVGARARRGACCPTRACPTRRGGAGGRGTRAATRRCGRPATRRRRRSRRRRRRDRPWGRGPRGGTTPRPHRRRHRAG